MTHTIPGVGHAPDMTAATDAGDGEEWIAGLQAAAENAHRGLVTAEADSANWARRAAEISFLSEQLSEANLRMAT